MSKIQPDYNYKILLLGSAAVGKTSLVQRFVHDRFDSSYLMTIGMEPSEKHIDLEDGTRVALSIWDLAGQERFRFIRHTFYKGARAALLVYDLTRAATLKDVQKWEKEFVDNCGKDVIKVLIGNKEDLKNQIAVSKKEYDAVHTKIKSHFSIRTSALTGNQVEEAFTNIAQLLVNQSKK
ncbi:MAG: GTP-binding protein [Candidatus Heimdallarchaeota archaeon]|nr:GTP-binding protein [Candidatus Heimdallarchaeota archaeon]MCG3254704.1 GTP-binding protein [Candidatus Heimdallarchaeota archaeon]MCK4609785.1 GTP-binding protein [Candidatus Heimdallarchaeota archaeon]